MRIASLCTTISRTGGGVSPAVRGLNRALADRGIQVTTHAAQDALNDEELALWEGMATDLHPVRSMGPINIQLGLRDAVKASRPDIVHLHGLWLHPSIVAERYPGADGVKAKIISPHGMLDGWALRNAGWKKRIALRLFERANLESANCLHALNRSECDAIRAAGYEMPVAVIPNGVDLEEFVGPFGDPPWANSVPRDAKVLFYIGRIHPKKGIDRLIDAFAALSDDERGDWHLVIAGWDQGGLREQLELRSRKQRLADRVHFVGPQFADDKGASFQRADAFILPSLSEGLPITVLEAFAFRLPVLMTDACNMPECFEARAALRIHHDALRLRDELRTFFAMSEGARERLGLAGRKMVETHYTWESVGAKMEQVYLWAAGRKPAPECLDVL